MDRIIIPLNEFVQKDILRWLQAIDEKEFALYLKGYPQIIFRKEKGEQ